MKSNTRRRFPWFWLFYVLYIALFIGALYYGLSRLWDFLDVYERTRPVHFMEEALPLFEEEHSSELQGYLTNQVENPYETDSVILELFFDSIEGKEITFGKLSGSYTESHPVYAVLADGVHVATASFTSDQQVVGYNFSGWQLENVSLLVTPTKNFAVTVPSSMEVTINGLPVAKEHMVSTIETGTPVSYVNYAFSGLYKEADIRVTDRYGSPVPLSKDEETGGLYYKLSYAYAPSDMTLSFGGHILGEENTLVSGLEVKELSFLPQIAERFSEYSEITELVTVPTFTEYYIDFAYTKDEVIFTDRLGCVRTPEYDPVMNKYSHGLVSNDSLQEECAALVTDFLQKYALFCAERDNAGEELKPFFPKKSEYCKLIISMDNDFFGSYSSLEFENHQLVDFFAYTENLVYIQMSIDEKVQLKWPKQEKLIKLNHPIWLVKMDGNWYIARIIFESFTVE